MPRIFSLSIALLALAAPLPAHAVGLDFPDSPNIIWSSQKTTTTPENNVKFHGDFSNESLTASLDNLPAHDFLEISAQLLILRSWDGIARTNGGGRMGPDFFRLGLDDGRTLVHACFSNTPVMSGFTPASTLQTYPSPVPGDHVPAMTGSDYKNTFGYAFPTKGPQPPITVHQDSVYNLKMTIPHSAAKVILSFRGMGLQEIADESWGVMGLQITPRNKSFVQERLSRPDVLDPFDPSNADPAPPFNPAQLLQTTAGRDPVAANEAFWKLVAANQQTVAYLATAIDPVPVDVRSINIRAADVYKFDPPKDETDHRIQDLLIFGIAAEPALRDLRIESSESPTRLDWALMELNMLPVDDPKMRRWIVATRILEAIATPESKKLRTTLFTPTTK